MMLGLLITGGVVLALLTMLAAIKPVRSPLSRYELNRQREAGDPVAAEALRREELLVEFDTVRRHLIRLLLVALTLLSVASLGWLWGPAVAVAVAFFYGRVADTSLLRGLAKKLFRPREKPVLDFIGRHDKKLQLLLGKKQAARRAVSFGSREELFHLITESGTVLSTEDKKLLTHALAFTRRRAADIMTKREDIVSVEHTELLGPLVLSDLHKTGHSCFPVIVRDLDQVVGMLDIRDHLTLEAKRSLTAAKTMTPRVFYIRGDQTLDHALATFVRTRHHLLVVVDENGATLGLLSLRDALEALFGRPIADEFASDSDLHLVAGREL
jgi:CBS domain containing-hemolysin-like protein